MVKEKDIFDTAEEKESCDYLEDKDKKRIPRPIDPEWTEYILNQLTKDEKYEEYPKLDGLKRLLIREIGEIKKSSSKLVEAPSFDNMFTYVVEHKLHVAEYGGNLVKYKAVAEANATNLDAPYDKYPASIASTRAYGRAVRDALKLKNVVAAEEMSKSDSSDLALSSQVNGIYIMCKKNGLDIMKVINWNNLGKIKLDAPEKLDREAARECLVLLNKLQQNAKLAEDYK